MQKWLVQSSDLDLLNSHKFHPLFLNLATIHKENLDSSFWLGVTHDSFQDFLNQAHIQLESVDESNLSLVRRELSKLSLGPELKNRLRGSLLEFKESEVNFEVELLLHIPGLAPTFFPWEPLCEISTKGVEGLFQCIKACWMNLFRVSVLNELRSHSIDLSKLKVSILIRRQGMELLRGQAFSYSPRCAWDQRYMVVTCQNGGHYPAFLVDRQNLNSFYYGKTSDALEESPKTLENIKNESLSLLISKEQTKSVAEFLLSAEKILDSPLQMSWSLDFNGKVTPRRISDFDRSPPTIHSNPALNPKVRNFWDQTFLNWNPSAVLKPFWFSLIPRNFRTLLIQYSGALGVKRKLSSDYEKVFRGLWGILRGRPYLNMAALHRVSGMGAHYDLSEELEMIVPIWMKRYDREQRESWDHQWPQLPEFNKSELMAILKQKKIILKNWPKKVDQWVETVHELREALVSNQWKEKSVSSMIESFQSWERKYIPKLVPILLAEFQYWNLVSWYFQGAQKPAMSLTWDQKHSREPLNLEGGWFDRRALEKLYDEMEMLGQVRPKYLSMLMDIYDKLRSFFELMGEKYKSLGQLESSEDFFFITLEEILAFEEGRAATTSWKELVKVRQEEYRIYRTDLKVPEIWMTSGLVGLATRYPSIISLRDRKNPLGVQNRSEKMMPGKIIEPNEMESLGFLTDEVFIETPLSSSLENGSSKPVPMDEPISP